MKLISVSVHCYNEADNIEPLAQAIVKQFETKLTNYNYEIVFIDNDSTDGTQSIIRRLCADNPNIKAIFNAKNFEFRSGFYGIMQVTGDCGISMAADFQDPPELIPKFVAEWEKGAVAVCGVKNKSKELIITYKMRSLYYKIIRKFSNIDQIDHFTGFGLYDRKFLSFVRTLNEPIPYMRGIVAEYGYNIAKVYFEQPRRRAGKSKLDFLRLYDIAMRGLTTYTKIGVRMSALFGIALFTLNLLAIVVCALLKLLRFKFISATTIMFMGVCLLISLLMILISFLGEYVLTINTRVMNRPLVLEKERINFEKEQ